jgi:putative ABC transport system permease protein
MAIKNIFSNKMRSILTMLGIIIGIGSVIVITSIGAGSQASINEQFETLGAGRITVSVSNSRSALEADLLTMEDYRLLRDFEGIRYISPTYSGSGVSLKLLDPTETKNASVTGITGDYYNIESQTLLHGRYINDNDVENSNKVCVINDTTAEKVFGFSGESVIGERISVRTWRGSQKYTVVGVLENENAQLESQYSDMMPETLYLPITTVMKFFNSKFISNFSIIVDDPDNIDAISVNITDALHEAHRNADKYYAQNMMNIMEQINSVLGTVTLLISFVAGISLLVGGIGVMNIMLVTVTERTREIGIRKSIGAKNSNILVQFLIEAIILTGTGGALGLLLGWGGGNVAANFMDISSVLSVQAIVIAVSISLTIGIVFGVYPARKASLLDPIEALRYE